MSQKKASEILKKNLPPTMSPAESQPPESVIANKQEIFWNKPSPFLIPPIFESLSKYFTYYQLKEYQTVCKDWYLMLNSNDLNNKFVIETLETAFTKLEQECPNRCYKFTIRYNSSILFGDATNLPAIFAHKKLRYISVLNLEYCLISKTIFQQILCLLEPNLNVLSMKGGYIAHFQYRLTILQVQIKNSGSSQISKCFITASGLIMLKVIAHPPLKKSPKYFRT